MHGSQHTAYNHEEARANRLPATWQNPGTSLAFRSGVEHRGGAVPSASARPHQGTGFAPAQRSRA